jgi:chromosome segregation ATPase
VPRQGAEGATTWREICASLREQLHQERTLSTGLRQNTGAIQIDLSFKKEELSSMREKIKVLEGRVIEAETKLHDAENQVGQSENKIKQLEWEYEVSRHEVEDLQSTMETRLKELVKDLKTEVTTSKDVTEALRVRFLLCMYVDVSVQSCVWGAGYVFACSCDTFIHA